MPGSSKTDSVARRSGAPYRVLLDQNFPKPPGFDVSDIDSTVEVVHVADFDVGLTKARTPDWLIYLRAADARFDALVTRDQNQLGLREEMWVLTRIRLTLITFRRAIEDPIVEWGQLLAYLPEIRRQDRDRSSQILLLPRPDLGPKNTRRPRDELHKMATELGVSANEIRDGARASAIEYLNDNGITGTVRHAVDARL